MDEACRPARCKGVFIADTAGQGKGSARICVRQPRQTSGSIPRSGAATWRISQPHIADMVCDVSPQRVASTCRLNYNVRKHNQGTRRMYYYGYLGCAMTFLFSPRCSVISRSSSILSAPPFAKLLAAGVAPCSTGQFIGRLGQYAQPIRNIGRQPAEHSLGVRVRIWCRLHGGIVALCEHLRLV